MQPELGGGLGASGWSQHLRHLSLPLDHFQGLVFSGEPHDVGEHQENHVLENHVFQILVDLHHHASLQQPPSLARAREVVLETLPCFCEIAP